MKKILALCCVAAGLIGFSATGAQASEVNALPAIAHLNYYGDGPHYHRHGRWVWRHHQRIWTHYY